jgi:hypothetical protein
MNWTHNGPVGGNLISYHLSDGPPKWGGYNSSTNVTVCVLYLSNPLCWGGDVKCITAQFAADLWKRVRLPQ